MLNLIMKWSGMGYVWEKVDGIKAYIVGTVTILTGAAGLLQEFLAVSEKHDFSALIKFAQGVPHDPMWAAILTGAGIIAAAHKADKVIAATANPKTMAIMVPMPQAPAQAPDVAPEVPASPAPAETPPAPQP